MNVKKLLRILLPEIIQEIFTLEAPHLLHEPASPDETIRSVNGGVRAGTLRSYFCWRGIKMLQPIPTWNGAVSPWESGRGKGAGNKIPHNYHLNLVRLKMLKIRWPKCGQNLTSSWMRKKIANNNWQKPAVWLHYTLVCIYNIYKLEDFEDRNVVKWSRPQLLKNDVQKLMLWKLRY